MSILSPSSGLVGQALFLSGLQFALASCEMSSRYSVSNFSKDQKTLQSAANALSTYLIIAIIWTIATCLVLYPDNGKTGIFWGLACNLIFVSWIAVSYILTFRKAARENGLQMPKMFNFGYNPSPIPREIKTA